MRRTSHLRQRGAALLTAMIIVTLVATLSAAMVWQQWRAVQVESAERARAQSAWILSGALDFAKLILYNDTKPFTALTEPWATPLAESRLSTFLAVDKSNADDGPEAFLSGNINDAQARYNLTNLLKTDSNGKKSVDRVEVGTLQRLCETAGIETGIAERIANALLQATGTSATAPLQPASVAQLTWLGLDEASVQALAPFVVLLPLQTEVNVNTAAPEVLSAAVHGLDVGTAERLVQLRQRTPFKTLPEFTAQIPPTLTETSKLAVRSSYFEVRGRLRLVDHVLVERSLLFRAQNRTSKVLQRERVSSVESAGG